MSILCVIMKDILILIMIHLWKLATTATVKSNDDFTKYTVFINKDDKSRKNDMDNIGSCCKPPSP